ncbi:MAG: ABC transporter ATP-binding protein [Acidobacteriota bacterium]
MSSSAAPALEVKDVHFAYGKVKAVDGVSLDVRPGEIFGLLGPNGAGKTTTISMIAGLRPPASGSVLIFGEEAAGKSGKGRARLGVVPQDIALYEELTVAENLRFWARLYGVAASALDGAVKRAAELGGLSDRLGDRVAKLSGGLKRRVNLAVGLVHGPDLLLLDEPTVGIDPQARLAILEVVKAQAAAGKAVLYTSHYLEEAEALCARLAIIDKGRVLAHGTVAELRRLVGEGPVVSVRGKLDEAQVGALAKDGASILSRVDGGASFAVADQEACARFVRELFASGLPIDDVRIQEPTLQSLFLKLTGRELRD